MSIEDDRISLEAILLDEKKIVLLEVLPTRIEQHEKAFAYVKARIDACIEKAGKSPAHASTMKDTIDGWYRIRHYHSRVIEDSKILLAQLKR